VKNFGIFQRAEDIRRKSNEIEEVIKSNIENGMYSIWILNEDVYPDILEWGTMRDHLPTILKPNSKSMKYSEKIKDGWNIWINYAESPSPFNEWEIFPEIPSYIFTVNTRLHPNDEQNLKDKLEEGCDNLNDHGEAGSINLIFIRIPEEMPLELCATWSQDYLESTDSCVSMVILYQPIVVEVAHLKSGLAHCCKYVLRSADVKKLNSNDLELQFTVGRKCTGTPPIEIRVGDKKIRCSDTKHYHYQSGHIYLKPDKQYHHVEIIAGILAESFDLSGTKSDLKLKLPANNKLILL
jgi:hypothetical protein